MGKDQPFTNTYGTPIRPSWHVPVGAVQEAFGPGVELWAHPYTIQRLRLERQYRAMLRTRFSADLLVAAGVPAW